MFFQYFFISKSEYSAFATLTHHMTSQIDYVAEYFPAFFILHSTVFVFQMSYVAFLALFSYIVMVQLKPLNYNCVMNSTIDFLNNATSSTQCMKVSCDFPCLPWTEILLYFWIGCFFLEELRQVRFLFAE